MTAVRPLLDRGVWKAPYLLNGREVLQAIDRHGNCVRRVRLSLGVDEEVARAWLEGYLEHVDPLPQLRLVRPIGAAAHVDPGLFVRYLTIRH